MAEMANATRTRLPTGTWQVDPVHSRIGFAAKHLGIATVRGFFREFEGTLDLDERRAYGTVKTASLDTNDERRDEHLRSPPTSSRSQSTQSCASSPRRSGRSTRTPSR
jgi:polyisoprenoid-binding protein YceI